MRARNDLEIKNALPFFHSENGDGNQLYYEEKGSGEPFIFLHGNGEDSSYFRAQIDYFSGSYRVIALDTRGHGRSPRGSAPFTIEQFACDLHDFMVEHRISGAVILGFSDGANIAMNFAMKHPGMVRALILNGGNLDPSGVKRSTQLPIEVGYNIARRFASRSAAARQNAELLSLMVREPNLAPADLSGITAPTLVICGTRDMIKESHTKTIAQSIPHAKLVLLKGDHFLAHKRPAEFNQTVAAFLRGI